MSLIKHLPVDILFNVFNYATPNIDRSPTRWKRSLVLLAVCREWRDVAKRVVYRYTFVRDPFSDSGQYDELHFKTIKKRRNVSDNDSDDNSYDYSDDYSSSSQSAVFGDMYDCGYDSCEDVFDVGTGTMYHIAPGRIHSNFKLVLQNGFGDLVTHISMMERRYSDEYQPHIHLLDAFGFKGIYRSVPARYSYSQMVVNNNKNRANQTISPEETDMSSRSLASEIVRQLPNVLSVRLSWVGGSNKASDIMTQLLAQYMDQLTKIKFNVGAEFMVLFDAPVLRELDIAIPDGYFPRFQINPTYVKSLVLSPNDYNFRWSFFTGYDKPNGLVFENLERLVLNNSEQYFIYGGEIVRYDDQDEDCSIGKDSKRCGPLLFPKLKLLELNFAKLTSDDYMEILQSPIKELRYAGDAKGALFICQHNIGVLDSLVLKFVRRDREPHDDQLLESINKIFHKTGNIETVLCILDLKNYNIDWDIVNWPHVTQLEVHNVERFDLMLAAIPRMQNLASLAIVFDFISARNNSIIINGLNTLREQHQPPFDSNVNSLRIVLNDQSPDHIPDIITELRHYFPTLEDVVVTAT